MRNEQWIAEELGAMRSRDLDRGLVPHLKTGGKIEIGGRSYLNFSSNDYLDLANHPEVIGRSRDYLDRFGCGATASRLVAGTLSESW